ncbi:MAG: hypothetical protein Fur0041_16810 [Bacteroidia bacterium]
MLGFVNLRSQDMKLIDSLNQLIRKLPDSAGLKAKAYNDLAWEVSYLSLDSAIPFVKKAQELSERYKHSRHLAQSWNVLGTIYTDKGDYQKAIECHFEAIRLRENQKPEVDLANSYQNLALVYTNMDSSHTALIWQKKAYRIYLENKSYYQLCMTCNNIGVSYNRLKIFDSAVVYYKQGLLYSTRENRPLTLSMNHGGLAYAYAAKKERALAHYHASMCLNIIRTLNSTYELMGAYESAANTYVQLEEHQAALHYLDSALMIAQKLGVFNSELQIRQERVEILIKSGNFKEAFEELVRFESLKDTLLSEEKTKSIRDTEEKYKKDKNEKELAILQKKQQSQNWIVSVVTFSILGLIILIGLLYGRIRMGKKAGSLLGAKKLEIEEKNKNITDSIQYARKIQEAVLPEKTNLNKFFQDAFIINRPRDIVGGDFWWMQQKGDFVWLCVADCTGHGVPGAFMSVMCSAFLNETVNTSPGDSPDIVLNKLRKKITGALAQSSVNNDADVKDGMDAVLLKINLHTHELEAACANNPVWIIRDNNLVDLKPDKFPVGVHYGEEKPFSLHTFQLMKGDQLYCFTDGFADQFGGAQGKKFKPAKMKSEFLNTSGYPANEQSAMLENIFDTWKGDLEQVDDVMMLAVKI